MMSVGSVIQIRAAVHGGKALCRGSAWTSRNAANFCSYLDPSKKRRTVRGGREHERDDKPSLAPLPRIHRENCVAKIENGTTLVTLKTSK